STIDRLSAVAAGQPTSIAAKARLRIASIASASKLAVAIVAPMRISAKATAPLGVIRAGCKVVTRAKHRNKVVTGGAIEQGRNQELYCAVERVRRKGRCHRRARQ